MSSLPEGTLLLSHQIAGHYHDQVTKKLGMLSHVDGSVLKPIPDGDVRGLREQRFYQQIFDKDCEDSDFLALRNFVAVFLGVFETSIDGKCVSYMKLSDVTKEYENPSVMDVKVGQRAYDPNATDDKIQKEISKYPLMEEIGFRILGMRVYDSITKEYLVHGKHFGLALSSNTIHEGFLEFIHKRDQMEARYLLKGFLIELERIRSWFETQRKVSFYSSSLLFVYDGRCSDKGRLPPTVKLIDFAHVFQTKAADNNYLYGLKAIIKTLTHLSSTLN